MITRRLALYIVFLSAALFSLILSVLHSPLFGALFGCLATFFCWKERLYQQARFFLFTLLALIFFVQLNPQELPPTSLLSLSLIVLLASLLRFFFVHNLQESIRLNSGFAEDLKSALPKKALLFVDLDIESEVEVEKIQKGSLVKVATNEAIPLDGEVESGSSLLDETPIGGGAEPRPVGPGHLLRGGAINRGSQLLVRTEAMADRCFARLAAKELESVPKGLPLLYELFYGILLLCALAKGSPLLFFLALCLDMSPLMIIQQKLELKKIRERIAKGWIPRSMISSAPSAILLPLERELCHPLPEIVDWDSPDENREHLLSLATGVARFRAEPWALAILEEARKHRLPFPWVEKSESGALMIEGKKIELKEESFSEGRWKLSLLQDGASSGGIQVKARMNDKSIEEARKLLETGVSLVFFHRGGETYGDFWQRFLPQARFISESRAGVVAEATEKLREQGLKVWRCSRNTEWENQDLGLFFARFWVVRGSFLPSLPELLHETYIETTNQAKRKLILPLTVILALAIGAMAMQVGGLAAAMGILFLWVAPKGLFLAIK